MTYDFKTLDKRGASIVEWLAKEFSTIRTGSATPTLLDGIQVESYGSKVPLNQVGTVGVEDPRTLRISIWDKGSIQAIEKAINDADFGVSVVVDDAGVRVMFPELTSDRREQLLKIAKVKLEEARVSLRVARDDTVKDIETFVKSGNMSENDKFGSKEEMQKKIDARNEEFSSMYAIKETEINQ